MFVMLLLVPVAMVFFGSRFEKRPPKEINTVFGYRTSYNIASVNECTIFSAFFDRVCTKVTLTILKE